MGEGAKPMGLEVPGGPGAVGVPVPAEGLNPYSLTIPEKFGKIEEVFQGTPGSPVIVHIQDAHANYEAQVNIKNILTHLSKNYNMNLIQLEGASSKLNPEIFETAYLKEANQKLADYLMREGRLSGAEAFAIESEKPVELHGIENRTLYMENLRTFRSVYAHQAEITDYFKCLRMLAKDLRTKLLNDELLDLTRNMEAYAKEKIDLIDYLLYLDGLAEKHKLVSLKKLTEITRFPNLVRIMRLHELEKQLDEKQLKKESQAIKAAFLKKTSDPKAEELLASLELKKKGMKPRAYFKKITALAGQHGIDLLGYPQMRAMSEFLILQDEIEHHGLFAEVHRLERIIQKQLFRTKDERHLLQLIRDMELLEQYFKLEVNREKLTYVVRHYDAMKASYIKAEMDKLAQKLQVLPTDYKGDTLKMDQIMDDVEYFYRVVLERDRLFVENVLAKTKGSGADRTVLITGGFHTDGLTALLKKQNVSYLVVIPKVDVKQGNEKYIKIMTEGDSEVGSVFAGTFAVENPRYTVPNEVSPGSEAVYLQAASLGAGITFQVLGSRGEISPAAIAGQQKVLDRFNALLPYMKAALKATVPADIHYDTATGTATFSIVFRLNDRGKYYEIEYQAKVSAESYQLTPLKITPVPAKKAASWKLVNPNDLPGNNLPTRRVLNTDTPLGEIIKQAQAVPALNAQPKESDIRAAFVFPGVVVIDESFSEEVLPILYRLRDNQSALRRVAELVEAGQPLTRDTLARIQARTQAADVTSADIAAAVPDDSKRVQQLAALFGLTQGNKTRVLVVPLMDESENSRAQLISLRETMQSNKGAAAVVIGKKAQNFVASVFGLTLDQLKRDPVLGRMQFFDVKEGKDVLAETVDVIKRRKEISRAYDKLDSDFKITSRTDLFQKGYVRVLVPEGAKVGERALEELLRETAPGVVQFQSQLQKPKVASNPDTAYAYATIEIKGTNLVPTEDERAEFAKLLQDSGLDQYIVPKGAGVWEITNVQELVETLVKDFLAAREIAIRA